MSNVDPKIYTSLLAGKILLRANDFLPLKVYYTFVSTLDAVQICRNFSLSATLHTQKKVKEIAYILTCYQALLKGRVSILSLYTHQKILKRRQYFK